MFKLPSLTYLCQGLCHVKSWTLDLASPSYVWQGGDAGAMHVPHGLNQGMPATSVSQNFVQIFAAGQGGDAGYLCEPRWPGMIQSPQRLQPHQAEHIPCFY